MHRLLLIIVKEPKVLKYFGPARSLLDHLAPLWDAAADIIFGELFRSIRKEHPTNWENVATALTHPEIFDRYCSTPGREIFEAALGVHFYFGFLCNPGNGESTMDEIKNYLLDRERAGRYFVDGGMYATLCLRLFKVVLASDTL